MTRSTPLLSAVSLAALLLAGAAQAQLTTPPPSTTPAPQPGAPGDARQAKQQDRIGQGVSNGQLTPQETTRLERRETRIDNSQARAEADGKVTDAERKRIHKLEKKESHQVNKKVANDKKVPAPQ